jgi:hypothetical protein
LQLRLHTVSFFKQSFNRPNLSYEVRKKGATSKCMSEIAELLDREYTVRRMGRDQLQVETPDARVLHSGASWKTRTVCVAGGRAVRGVVPLLFAPASRRIPELRPSIVHAFGAAQSIQF